jgi:hypothetical protein
MSRAAESSRASTPLLRAKYRAGFLAGVEAAKTGKQKRNPCNPGKPRQYFAAGYQDGMASVTNPGKLGSGERFAACVRSVEKRGGAADPRAVCAAAGRKKYGKAAFQKMAAAGRKRAARGNPSSLATYSVQRLQRDGKTWVTVDKGLGKAIAERVRKYYAANWPGARVVREKRNPCKNPRNPAEAAARAYQDFHGHPPTEVIEVESTRHFHTHLAGGGLLIKLFVRVPSERKQDGLSSVVELDFDNERKPTYLTYNEAKDQLFVTGGDQSVDLKAFGIRTPHEKQLLGTITRVWYFTTKSHLGSEGGTAIFKHNFGEEGGEKPSAVYRVRDKHIEIVGGDYSIPPEGIRN